MRALILGASPEAYWDHRWTPDVVICADGGWQQAEVLGLSPDLVVGDGDSGGVVKDTPAIMLPREKELSDSEACAEHALALGAREIVLIGMTGGRLDHFMANVGLLTALATKGVKARLLDRDNEMWVYDGSEALEPPHRYAYFSLVPLDERAEDVSLEGVRYPLYGETLYRERSRGVSNEPMNEDAVIQLSIGGGACLVVLSERK